MPTPPPAITRTVFLAFRKAILQHVGELRFTLRKAAKGAGVRNPGALTDRELTQYLPPGQGLSSPRELSRENARFTGQFLEPHIDKELRQTMMDSRKFFLKELNKALPDESFIRKVKKELKTSKEGKASPAALIKEQVLAEEVERIGAVKREGVLELERVRNRALKKITDREGIDFESAKRRILRRREREAEDIRFLDEFAAQGEQRGLELEDIVKGLEEDKVLPGGFRQGVPLRSGKEFSEIERERANAILAGRKLKKPFKKTISPGKADVIPLFPESGA